MIPGRKQTGAVVKTSRNRRVRVWMSEMVKAGQTEEEVVEDRTRRLPHPRQCNSPPVSRLLELIDRQYLHQLLEHHLFINLFT